MKSGDVVEMDGRDYRMVEVDQYLCTNCKRETFTGLCGCAEPSPVSSGRGLLGFPLEAEEALT